MAIVLATSAERLSKTGILLAEAEDRRSRIKECTELIDTTQQRYADLAIAMRSLLGEAALGPEVREALDMHTLDRLIRQPEPGFTRYLNPPSHRYPSLSAPAYRARVEAVARLGALAQGESFPGSGNWEPDEPVRRRAAKLVRALEAGLEMQQDRAAEIAAAKLNRMGDASLSLAGAIEATMGNLYCRGLVLAPNETVGTVRIERARRAAEGFRSIARGLQARRDSAIEFLGEVAATVHLLFPRPFKGLSRLPYPYLLECATWCRVISSILEPRTEPTSTAKGVELVRSVLAIFPLLENYRSYFQKAHRQSQGASAEDGIPVLFAAALADLDPSTQIGQAFIDALGMVEEKRFTYRSPPEDMFATDSEFEDALLVHCVSQWLGDQQDKFLTAVASD